MKKTTQEYQKAVDPDLVNFIKEVRATQGNEVNSLDYKVSSISERQRTDVERLTGQPLRATGNFINGSRINHIDVRHGTNGKADRSMADINDIARIGYVLDNYDDVDILKDQSGKPVISGQYNTRGGKPATVLIYVKRVNGFYNVIEAINDGKRRRIEIVSAYKTQNNPL